MWCRRAACCWEHACNSRARSDRWNSIDRNVVLKEHAGVEHPGATGWDRFRFHPVERCFGAIADRSDASVREALFRRSASSFAARIRAARSDAASGSLLHGRGAGIAPPPLPAGRSGAMARRHAAQGRGVGGPSTLDAHGRFGSRAGHRAPRLAACAHRIACCHGADAGVIRRGMILSGMLSEQHLSGRLR